MRILILGAGKMGSFFVDLLSFEHEVAVYDVDPKRLRFMYNTQRFTRLEEIDAFNPEFLINAVSLNYTLDVFKAVTPHLSPDCILSDIASVKTNLKDYYDSCGFRYVSTHPMFGPTFANLGALSNENAIISRDFSFEDEEHKRHTEVLNLDQLESQAIRRAIELSNGNLSEAADMLGITRYALYRKMK